MEDGACSVTPRGLSHKIQCYDFEMLCYDFTALPAKIMISLRSKRFCRGTWMSACVSANSSMVPMNCMVVIFRSSVYRAAGCLTTPLFEGVNFTHALKCFTDIPPSLYYSQCRFLTVGLKGKNNCLKLSFTACLTSLIFQQ